MQTLDPANLYLPALSLLEDEFVLDVETSGTGRIDVRCEGQRIDLPRKLVSSAELLEVEKKITSLLVDGCSPRSERWKRVPVYRAFSSLLFESLDDGSSFLPREEVEDLAEPMGEASIGISIVSRKAGGKVIAELLPNSPAIRSRLRVGSRILSVGEVAVEDLTLHESVRLLRGEEGSTVTVQVLPPTGPPETATLRRERVTSQTVEGPIVIESGGYIRVRSFREATPRELEAALQGARSFDFLILDLRGNSGGLLDAIVRSADLLLPPGAPIGSVVGRSPAVLQEFVSFNPRATDVEVQWILVDQDTASGAEMFSESLRSAGMALLAGLPTAGNGSVHTIFPLSSQSGVKLRTGKIVAGRGREIPSDGFIPDFTVPEFKGGVMPPESDVLVQAVIREIIRGGVSGPDAVAAQQGDEADRP